MPTRTPLRSNRDYLLWWSGDTGSTLGVAIQSFALPLVATLVTGSPALGGLVASVGLVAGVLTGLPGGVLVDRFDRRRLLVWYAVSGAAVWGTFAALAVTGGLSTPVLVVLAALGGVRAGLFGSLTNACLKSVVTPDQVPEATSANQGRDAVVGLLGAPVGGVLMGLGPAAPFVATAVLALSTLVPVVGVRASLDPGHTGSTSATADLREGLAWAARVPLLRASIATALLLNLALGGLLMTVLFTLLAAGVPGWQLGAVEGAAGVGMLVGAVAAPWLVRRFRGGAVIVAGIGWVAVTGTGLALTLDPWLLAGTMLLLGLGVAPVNAVLGGLLTTAVPAAQQGRVGSVVMTGAGALSALVPVLAGAGLTTWGRVPTASAFVAVLVLGAVLALASRSIRSVPRASEWQSLTLG